MNPQFQKHLDQYLQRFDYSVVLNLGPSWDIRYKEFYDWARARLGTQYRDWFITTVQPQGHYRLHCRSDKWSTFLALTWIDSIA